MSTSQNGYPVLETSRTTGPLPRLRKIYIGGTGRYVYLRDGSAGFLLAHFAHWWDENIEPIDTGILDDWGWAVRPVRGQTAGYSNHASGTAIDINATRHPRGIATAKTLSAAEIARIRTQLEAYEGVLRWGGDYTKVPDGMHVELVKPLGDAERVARKLWQSKHGAPIIAANPGLAGVIWDGKVPGVTAPPPPAPAERLAYDSSYSPPNPAAAKAAGYRGSIRYGSRNPLKNLTVAEAARTLAAGLWLAGVWEDGAARAGAGAGAGATDVRDAEAFFDSVGYPRDSVIFYAVDYDATAAEVAPYFAAVRAGALRPVGVYGGFKVIEGTTADYYWQTVAWSAGKVSAKANWLQRTTHRHTITGAAANTWDEDLLIGGNVPVWNPGEPAYRKPPPVVVPAGLRFKSRTVLPLGTSDHKAVVEEYAMPSGTIIRTGTANVQGTDSAVASNSYLDSLLAHADLWVWNEITTAEQQKHVLSLPGWSTYMANPARVIGSGEKDDMNAVCISFRDAVWEFVQGKAVRLHGGASGITPERVDVLAQVRLKATLELLWRQGTQTVHHVDVGGKARTSDTLAGQNDRAKASFPILMRDAYDAAKSAPVIGSGDLNVDFDADRDHFIKGDATSWFPYTVFREHVEVYRPNVGAPTHGSRKIDWFWFRQEV